MSEWAANDIRIISEIIPDNPLVCIEHPGLVRSSQNALKTLGGNYMIDKVCRKIYKYRILALRITSY